MMSFTGRWLDGVGADSSVGDVARRALTQKLPLVFYYLPLAACHHEDNVEYVHQLRVATRRAVIVIKTFTLVLPSRRARKIVHGLRHVRRSAGPAREIDVLQARLSSEEERLRSAGINAEEFTRLIALLANCREEAQSAIQRVYEKETNRRLEERSRDLVTAIRWRGDGDEPNWGKIAQGLLRPQINKVLRRSRKLTNVKDLHRFRIASKELRYAMELAAGAYDESFRTQLYPFVREVQQWLGDVNDHVCAVTLLEGLMKQNDSHGVSTKTFQWLLDRENQIVKKITEDFQDWWTVDRAEAFRQQLTEIIGGR